MSVANVIANVTALVVSTTIRRRALRMRMQRAMRLGSLPGQTFQPAKKKVCSRYLQGTWRRVL